MKKYQITLTEDHLRLIADAVEDWHRFLAGQCLMSNAMWALPNNKKIRGVLLQDVEPLIEKYDWAGNGCIDKNLRKAIAMSYGIYRQILHFFAMGRAKEDPNVMNWDVYTGATLTCPEQGGLIQIKEIKEEEG